MTDESRMNKAGCLVVVLVLASVFLHVKFSVKVVRVFLGNVTSFWSTFVLGGGGGNVTFHGIQFPRECFIIYVSLVPLGHIRMWRVRLSCSSSSSSSIYSQHARQIIIMMYTYICIITHTFGRSRQPYRT